MVSSFAFYPQVSWQGRPLVVRPASGFRQCYFSDIPAPWTKNLQSLQITWNITDEALPPSGNLVKCKVLRFWSGPRCTGSNIASITAGSSAASQERFSTNSTA